MLLFWEVSVFIVSLKSELFPLGDSELPENLAETVLDVDLFAGERGEADSQATSIRACGTYSVKNL